MLLAPLTDVLTPVLRLLTHARHLSWQLKGPILTRLELQDLEDGPDIQRTIDVWEALFTLGPLVTDLRCHFAAVYAEENQPAPAAEGRVGDLNDLQRGGAMDEPLAIQRIASVRPLESGLFPLFSKCDVKDGVHYTILGSTARSIDPLCHQISVTNSLGHPWQDGCRGPRSND